MNPRSLLPALTLAALALAPAASLRAADVAATENLQKNFAAPPMEARPLVRWWWFGPAVTKPQLEKEMNTMKEGGFGGFEVQPTYPLATDGQYPGLVNLKFMSPEFLDMLGFTAAKAKDLGLRMDLTIGSGWPYGGPTVTREESAQTLAQGGTVEITAGQTTVSPGAAAAAGGSGRGGRGGRGGAGGGGAPIMAALLGPVTDAAPGASPYISLKIENGAAVLPANLHGATQVTFYNSREGIMAVKRPAYGAEGSVVDHYGPTAIKDFITNIALPEINACGPNAPFSIFCDSLEINGEGWTPTFLAEFQKRRGYDLAPLLPALFYANFPKAPEIRGDYTKTVVEVFNDNFVKTFAKLAGDHNTRFRIQAYGTPPTDLMSYGSADLDEGEQYNWRTFSATRWAASASHMLSRPVASAEAFTWSHDPGVFYTMPIDIKAESNLDFLNGINSFCVHGWPYNAPGVEYPGWHFYVSAIFNDRNPWWIASNDMTTYLARASYLLRQGAPANDVALYLGEEDGYTGGTPGSLSTAGANGGLFARSASGLIPTILDNGYNFDFTDDGVIALRGKVDGKTLAFGDSKYKVIVLPNVIRMPLATLKKFADFANNGGILIAVGSIPSQAPGYLATAADHKAIQDLAAQIFTGPNAKGISVAAGDLGAALRAKLPPDIYYSKAHSELGFVHRHTDGGEVYFIVNTSNQPVSDTAVLRVDGLTPERWDAVTGKVSPVTDATPYTGATAVPVSLPAYGTQFIVFSSRKLPAPAKATGAVPAALDLSKGWSVTFKNSSPEADPAPAKMDAGSSWTADPALTSFSGVATFQKQVDVPAAMLATGLKTSIYFGEGQAGGAGGGGGGGGGHFTAAITQPIGDVAVVWVNGQRAGAAWCPPYSVDVTSFLKPGANDIRIQVGNRAVNYLSTHAEPDMATVKSDPRLGSGNRFSNPNMAGARVQPSGLLSVVQLTASAN